MEEQVNRRELATLFEPQSGIFSAGGLRMIGAVKSKEKKQKPGSSNGVAWGDRDVLEWIVREGSE